MDGFITSLRGLLVFSESMAPFRDIRNLLVESFDDDDISEGEFLFLYDANTSKNLDFPYDCYGSFDLMRWTTASVWLNFAFIRTMFPSF